MRVVRLALRILWFGGRYGLVCRRHRVVIYKKCGCLYAVEGSDAHLHHFDHGREGSAASDLVVWSEGGAVKLRKILRLMFVLLRCGRS